MKKIIVLILLTTLVYADEKNEYKYFPSNWPKHEMIKFKDEVMVQTFGSLEESPLQNLKNVNVYRMTSEKGIISIYIAKDKKCDIYFHAAQEEYFYGSGNGVGSPYLTFSIKKVENCLEKIDVKGIEKLLFHISASFYLGYFEPSFADYQMIEMVDFNGEYHYLATLDKNQQKTINEFVDQIEVFFKKNGIDVNKKPEKAKNEEIKKEKDRK